MTEKKKVLFLCTGNSCRSQMAEGWAHHFLNDTVDAYSAGVAPHGLDPKAIATMEDAGVDITTQTSNHLDEYADITFDLVVTVCNNAAEACPIFPGATRVHHQPFDDPPALAKEVFTPLQVANAYARVRNEIRDFVQKELPDLLDGN